MDETREQKEARRKAQCQQNEAAWQARHASMLRIPASYFFDILEAYVVDGDATENPFDIVEIVAHLKLRFPDDLTTIEIVNETLAPPPLYLDHSAERLHVRELIEEKESI